MAVEVEQVMFSRIACGASRASSSTSNAMTTRSAIVVSFL
jgi:hypothetical protein